MRVGRSTSGISDHIKLMIEPKKPCNRTKPGKNRSSFVEALIYRAFRVVIFYKTGAKTLQPNKTRQKPFKFCRSIDLQGFSSRNSFQNRCKNLTTEQNRAKTVQKEFVSFLLHLYYSLVRSVRG